MNVGMPPRSRNQRLLAASVVVGNEPAQVGDAFQAADEEQTP